MTNNQIYAIAYDSFNKSIANIQEQLDIKHGDSAGMFFSDNQTENAILNVLIDYINFELNIKNI